MHSEEHGKLRRWGITENFYQSVEMFSEEDGYVFNYEQLEKAFDEIKKIKTYYFI